MKFKSKTLGILGGGQLGRMSALAAANLGITTHIYCPEEGCPASLVTPYFTCADYDDETALQKFADSVDVITYEFENIPVETIRFLQKTKPVYPDEKLLEASQDRCLEKAFLNNIGILTAPWAPIEKVADIDMTFGKWGLNDAIIKTARFGYDGKGQEKISTNDDSNEVWKNLNTDKAILEGLIDFDYEISVIIARDLKGNIAIYPPSKNTHKNHILDRSIVPSNIPEAIETEAYDMTTKLADAVNLVGVLALELFITKDGKVLANEIAPRTHNSGHWTIDACSASQFDNHVRTVCGLPVANPHQHSAAEMINLIGDDVNHLDKYLVMDGANIHLYGKTEVKSARKMGHVTIIEKI